MTHTPGPLHVQQDSKWPYTISICTQTGEPIHSEPLICSSSRWRNLEDARELVGVHDDERKAWKEAMDRQMADMLLRAAAPDLLAACEEMEGMLRHDERTYVKEMVIRVNSAIAKARGGKA